MHLCRPPGINHSDMGEGDIVTADPAEIDRWNYFEVSISSLAHVHDLQALAVISGEAKEIGWCKISSV